MSFGDESATDLETARGRDWPSVRQFNVFIANRIGGMMRVIRPFESTDVRILSLTVVDSSDCAIIRLVPSEPERAVEILRRAKLPFTESDLLVIKMPEIDQPLVQILKALISSEVSLHYAYPLLVGIGYQGHNALAIHVDNLEVAAHSLQEKGFTLYTESDLNEGS